MEGKRLKGRDRGGEISCERHRAYRHRGRHRVLKRLEGEIEGRHRGTQRRDRGVNGKEKTGRKTKRGTKTEQTKQREERLFDRGENRGGETKERE